MKWPMVKIADFCKTGSGGTPSRSNPEFYQGDIPWIKSGDLREKLVTEASEFLSELAIQKSSAKIVPKGAILLAMYGATVGRMALLGIDAATNQAVCNIIPDESKAFQKYVYYALLSKVPYFLKNAIGGAQPNISQGMIKDTEIPLPPLEEQKRIAAILDKADAIRRKRQQAIDLADEFLRAVFLDMFGDPVTNPKGWEVKPLGEVCSFQGGFAFKSSDYIATGVPLVKITNVHFEDVEWDDISYLPEKMLKEKADFSLMTGDLVMAMTRPIIKSLNAVKVVEIKENDVPSLLNQRVGRFNEYEKNISKNFLKYFLYSEYFKAEIEKLCSVALQPNVSSKQIESIVCYLPPKTLQADFSRVIDGMTTLISTMKLASQENLFESLSQKAFSGDL